MGNGIGLVTIIAATANLQEANHGVFGGGASGFVGCPALGGRCFANHGELELITTRPNDTKCTLQYRPMTDAPIVLDVIRLLESLERWDQRQPVCEQWQPGCTHYPVDTTERETLVVVVPILPHIPETGYGVIEALEDGGRFGGGISHSCSVRWV